MRFRREESEGRVLMLRSDLIISELLHKFRTGYHFSKGSKGFYTLLTPFTRNRKRTVSDYGCATSNANTTHSRFPRIQENLCVSAGEQKGSPKYYCYALNQKNYNFLCLLFFILYVGFFTSIFVCRVLE